MRSTRCALGLVLGCHATGGASAPVATTAPREPASAAPASATPGSIPIALTFDDLPAHGPTLPGQTYLDIHRQLLETLAAHHVPRVYGFINGAQVETHEDGRRVLELWRDAGHPLGNHTWAHRDIGEVGAAAAIRDIDRNDALLAELMGDSPEARHARRVFRYPFLRQGRDRETLDAVRAHLAEQGYRIAEVSVDFQDYAYNRPFVRCSALHAEPTIAALRWNYTARGVEFLDWSQAASHAIWGRQIPHIVVMHSGTFDAVMLDELLDAYEQKGAHWITLDEALADRAYQQDVRVPSATGGTLLEQLIERDHPATPPYHVQSESLLAHICENARP